MPPHVAFFWGTMFFFFGVALKSFFSGTITLLVSAGIFIFLFLISLIRANRRIKIFSYFAEYEDVLKERQKQTILQFYGIVEWFVLSLFVIVGGFYYHFYDSLTRPIALPYGEEVVVRGKVIDAETRMAVQMFTIRASEPFKGKIRVVIDSAPVIKYGDEVELKGILERPEEPYVNYLKKGNIFSEMAFPEANRVNTKLWTTLGALYAVRDTMQSTFSRMFPAREAALMSGLTLGDTSQFTKEFREAMQRTGTTHIVALSGYNVMLIVSATLSILGSFLRRKTARRVAFIVILFFVLMTGVAASVVRAAIMAFLFIYLTVSGRLRNPRNVIAATALVMVLWNPRILVFDVGFQLSFLAFLGIVYIAPHIRAPQAIAYTLSAQFMTLPLLVGYFDRFYASSLIPNVLIVALVPFTTALGFLGAGIAFLIPQLSFFMGFLIYPFLFLETLIIEFFSRIAFFQISFNVGIFFSLVYYALIFKLFFLKSKQIEESSNKN